MRGVLSRCLDAVPVCVFCLFLLLGWIGESQAQPRVDESIRPYLSGAAQSALFGPDPQVAKEGKVPETLQAAVAQPTIGANTQVNDSSTEGCSTTGCTQSETSIAVHPTNPNNLVVGWNDLVGFSDPSVFDNSGFGFSVDGGLTWTDGGTPPNSSSTIRISGDPAVAICGDGGVHYANLYVDTVGTFSGLAVNNGSFVGDTLVFDPAGPDVAVSSTTDFLDKEYLVCDPVSNTLYMSYTRFIGGGGNGQIEFIQSTDGGVNWSTPFILQAEELIVNQGSYPAFGPDGQVCVAWERDWFGGDTHIATRCSTNSGLNFASRVRVGDVSPDSAVNPPNGYNRPTLNDFPSIAIDTSGGPHHGNIYVAWHTTPPPPQGPCSIFEEDFENGDGGFTPGNVENTLTWQRTTNRGANPGHSAVTSFYFGNPITFNYETDVEEGATLDSPPIDLTGLFPPLRLDLNYFLEREPTLSPFDAATVQISIDGGANFTTVASNTGTGVGVPLIDNSGVWNSVSIKLDDFAGQTIIIRFAFNTWDEVLNFFEGFYVDDVCITQTPVPDPRDVVISRSTDGGVMWSPPVQVNDDPPGADQWWPWVSVNENGEVGLIWYDRRIDPVANDLTDVYFALSRDGGMTFETNVRVTDTATQWTTTGSDGTFPNFGDYINLATGSPNFHATWADGRLGDPDVFYSTILIGEPELVADFGSDGIGTDGIWINDDSSWSQIASSDPEDLLIWGANLVADFGSDGIGADGIWANDGSSWIKIASSDPENMVVVDLIFFLIADFGSDGIGADGIWLFDGISWSKIASSDPENMVVTGFFLIADFGSDGIGADGIWAYDGISWSQIASSDPEDLLIWGANLVADFGSDGIGADGIWANDGISWIKIASSDPENMVVRGTDLIADFGSDGIGADGIWAYDGSSWIKIANSDPEDMLVWGTELVADFGSDGIGADGIWLFDGISWSKIASSDPENMVVRGTDLIADFGSDGIGADGIWSNDGISWIKIANSDPEDLLVW